MDRRQFLTAMAVAGAAQASFARAQGGPASGTFATPKDAARDAWLWGLPLIEMAQQRSERSAEGVKINTFQHQRALVTAKDQFVTTPNNDTLYSQAWLNLEKGPVTISVPASGTRYYCVPLMDMYSNNFAIIGTRTSGGSARTFTVIGPNDATIDPLVIRSPTNWVWSLAEHSSMMKAICRRPVLFKMVGRYAVPKPQHQRRMLSGLRRGMSTSLRFRT